MKKFCNLVCVRLWTLVSTVSACVIPEGHWGRFCIKRNIYSTQAKGAWCLQVGATAFLWQVRGQGPKLCLFMTPTGYPRRRFHFASGRR